MTIEEMKKIIALLKGKKEIALTTDLHTNRNTGKTDISEKNFIEYRGMASTLVTGIEKHRPMYLEMYKDLLTQTNLLTYQKRLEKFEALVNAIETEINNGLIKDEDKSADDDFTTHKKNIENIFENFNSCCRQARSRYDGRATIDVKDEYDVQDLLHILLRLHYKDIRTEEYTPSYAGKSSRMDFLLKEIKTVIEAKKTRDNLKGKEIGEELTLDISKYSTHPDCKKLY